MNLSTALILIGAFTLSYQVLGLVLDNTRDLMVLRSLFGLTLSAVLFEPICRTIGLELLPNCTRCEGRVYITTKDSNVYICRNCYGKIAALKRNVFAVLDHSGRESMQLILKQPTFLGRWKVIASDDRTGPEVDGQASHRLD